MQIVIEFSQTKSGDMDIRAKFRGAPRTELEAKYGGLLQDLVRKMIPKVGELLGGSAIVMGEGKPADS